LKVPIRGRLKDVEALGSTPPEVCALLKKFATFVQILVRKDG
jgi:hypothetical protein